MLDLEFQPGLVLDSNDAAAVAATLRAVGRTIVFTNGCFDLLHGGHVDYLQRAKALGDILIVGLNGDDSVRQLKGPERPILPEADRALVLAALRAVDFVVIFPDLTAETLVAAVRPDIYVKGGDWGAGHKTAPEVCVVEGYGGRVVFLPYLPGRSTSEIITKIRSL
jgi:glycerol-3-phosphate cytidylyltransferase